MQAVCMVTDGECSPYQFNTLLDLSDLNFGVKNLESLGWLPLKTAPASER